MDMLNKGCLNYYLLNTEYNENLVINIVTPVDRFRWCM